MIPAFIISYNRLTHLKAICLELLKRNCEPIILDTGSTYGPLLDWYSDCQYSVNKICSNYGHAAPWESRTVQDYGAEYYIVTDPDLDISGVPLDMIEHLKSGFKLASVNKVGLSLELNDLPENDYTQAVIEWEVKFWESIRMKTFYLSDIDTTLALYRKDSVEPGKDQFFTALRADRPYTARHLPWYNVPPLSDEEKYYNLNLKTCGHWVTKYNKCFKYENKNIQRNL